MHICVQVSALSGPAWTWRDERQAYYLHQFTVHQPELNYYNPNVRREMEVSITWKIRGSIQHGTL